MRVLPILFNTEMVRAILDGRKTATRRIVKPPYFVQGDENDSRTLITLRTAPKGSYIFRKIGHMPYPDTPYKIGDILYVRETWFYEQHIEDKTAGKPDLPSGRYSHRYIYKADDQDYPVNMGVGAYGWRPSIHMPKEAARIWLEVTDVRVERLQDITEEQAKTEGAVRCYEELRPDEDNTVIYQSEDEGGYHVLGFKAIWNSTVKKPDIKKYGWNVNPWVWVIEFKRCEKPESEVEIIGNVFDNPELLKGGNGE